MLNKNFNNNPYIFTCDIRIITKVNREKINILKSNNSSTDDYIPCCETELAKENAILLKVNTDTYIDIDTIKNNSDIKLIYELLKTGNIDNNIFIKCYSKDPYVGQLYISNLKIYNKLNENTLKLIKNN